MTWHGFVNGSFEDNGPIGDLRSKAPDSWDVNVPKDKFSGQIVSGWHTDGQYGLLFRANWFAKFSGSEMATVSQKLVLDGVEKTDFDLAVFGGNWLAGDSLQEEEIGS